MSAQVGLQYLPMQGNPPVVRSGMYYLPSGYKTSVMPVVVVFHGLAGNGSTALAQNWVVRNRSGRPAQPHSAYACASSP